MNPVPACIIFTGSLVCILQHPGGEEVLLEQAGKRQLFSLRECGQGGVGGGGGVKAVNWEWDQGRIGL